MGKRFYRFTGGLVRMFSHRMKTEWEVPFEEGPCVFVVNSVGFMGPVEMITKFSQREICHPWVNDELLEAKKIPAYARKDCWWKPGTFAAPVLNATVPYVGAALIPPLLKSVPYIPVYHDQRMAAAGGDVVQNLRPRAEDVSGAYRPGQAHLQSGGSRLLRSRAAVRRAGEGTGKGTGQRDQRMIKGTPGWSPRRSFMFREP